MDLSIKSFNSYFLYICSTSCFILNIGFIAVYIADKNNEDHLLDFPGGTVDKNLSASAGERGLIPGPGRSQIQQTS